MADIAFVESIMCTEYLIKYLCNRPNSLPKGLRGTCNKELAPGVAHEKANTDPGKYKPENPHGCVKYVKTWMLLLLARLGEGTGLVLRMSRMGRKTRKALEPKA